MIGMEINKFIELFSKAANKYSIEQMDIDNDGTITEAELKSLLNSKTEKDDEVKADLTSTDLTNTDKAKSENKSDGTYTKTQKTKEGKTITTKYNSSGEIVSKQTNSSYKNGNNLIKVDTEYTYNSDGSYSKKEIKRTYSKNNAKKEWKEIENYRTTKITKYDKDGKVVEGSKDAKVERLGLDVTDYKDKVKSKGTTVVIFGAGCGGCENLVYRCNKYAQELDALGINVVNVSNLKDTDAGELARKFGQANYNNETLETWLKDKGGFCLPLIIKFEDGEPVASLNFSHTHYGTNESPIGSFIDEVLNPYGTTDEETKKLHTSTDKSFYLEKLKSIVNEYNDDTKTCKDMWNDTNFSNLLKTLITLGVKKSKIVQLAALAKSGQYTVAEKKEQLIKYIDEIEK